MGAGSSLMGSSNKQLEAALVDIKKNNPEMKELSLAHNKLTVKDVKKLVEALEANSSITSLNLQSSMGTYFDWGKSHSQAFSLLSKTTSILYLNLSSNGINGNLEIADGNREIAAGISALASNRTFISLDLSRNQLWSTKAEAFAKNTTLISLDLSSNRINNSTAIALAKNETLASLNLSGNSIGNEGVRAFLKNTTLTSLNLYKIVDQSSGINRPISEETILALTKNTTLTSLDIDHISDKATLAVEEMLKRNRRQAKDFLDYCKEGDLESVQEQLENHTVSPYACDLVHDTGLHLAVASGQTEVARYLVKVHPHLLRFRNKDDKTALDLAREINDTTMIAILKGKVTVAPLASSASEESAAMSDDHAYAASVAPSTTGVVNAKDITLGRLLGQGGFGQVFKGTYKLAPVAIKTLLLDKLNYRMLAEFQQEGQLMAKLSHPNIIQFYGVTITQPYHIVMEYMEQGSLYEVLHGPKKLSWDQRVQWGIEVGMGLHYLHTFDPEILHRDLKSLNVLISGHNQAKLTDFGLAMSSLRSATKTVTKGAGSVETVTGSLRWMAPELLSLKPQYSAASDVYSYAMVLWELAARNIPYAQVSDDGIIRDSVKAGEREDIPKDCPAVLATLIQACWAQAASKRPTVSEAVDRLSQYQPSSKKEATSVAAQIAKSRGYAFDSEQLQAAGASSGYRYSSRP